MKKVLFTLVALFMASTMCAQNVLFSEDFENVATTQGIGAVPSGWTCYMNDNLGVNSNIAYFTEAWGVLKFDEGDTRAACLTWTDATSACDRWLVTPAITITDSGYYFCYTTSCASSQYPEAYNVKLSTTTNTVDAFTTTLANASCNWKTPTEFIINLDAFVGQTVYLAFQCTSIDGYYLTLSEVSVKEVAPNGMSLASLSIPNYAGLGNDVAVSGNVINRGIQPLTEYDVEYTVNGTSAGVYHVTGANIGYNQQGNFTHNVPFNQTTAGTYTIEVTVSNPNNDSTGIVESASLSHNILVYDASLTTNRNILLEEFTGAACGYCPAGYDRIHEAIGSRNDVVMVAHHAGYGTDGLSCNASSAMTYFYNAGGYTHAPAYMLDRTHFDASEPGPVMGIGDVSSISSMLNAAAEIPCFLNISIDNLNYSNSDRSLTGTVNCNFAGEVYGANTRLQIYLLEDSTMMKQADYYANPTTRNDYRHYNAVRASIVNDNWGVAVTPDANGTFSYNINYTVPTSSKAHRCHIVAFVYNYNSADANDCQVINATGSTGYFPADYVGIDEVAANVVLNVFPNPATNYVNVVANEAIANVTIMNAMGQTVYSNNNVNGESININTTDFAAGIYMITVKTNNGISTKRISVAK